jgi:hypothetical protein
MSGDLLTKPESNEELSLDRGVSFKRCSPGRRKGTGLGVSYGLCVSRTTVMRSAGKKVQRRNSKNAISARDVHKKLTGQLVEGEV